MDEALLEAFQRGERRALAQLLTLAAHGQGSEFLYRLPTPAKASRVVAITGSGGVGKSTLIGKLIEHIRKQSKSVAVLACDPQSPLSGGALLGDRFRMPSMPSDAGVFIRSVMAESGQGALTKHLRHMVQLLESFGFDVVLIETVGAGQGDTASRELADLLVLLLQPETGDDLQWEKAGVLEVADIIVIHKADLPGADSAATQVRTALDLAGVSSVPVLKVSARTGEGIPVLWDALGRVLAHPRAPLADGQELLRSARDELERRFTQAADTPRVQTLLDEWHNGTLSRDMAAASLLRLLSELPPVGS
jgi:LAO/AO transport system ATPase